MEIYVLRGIIVFLISFIVFRNITILPWEYLLVLDFIWGVLLYFFYRPCNYRFHRAVFAGVLGNWAAYLLNFLVNEHVDVTILWHQLLMLRECKIVCVNRYYMNLLYAPYWGKQR